MIIESTPVANGPLWRLAWKRLRQRPLQYALCILGIALGVAMMVSIDLANGSAQRAFALSTDAITGRTTHRIVAISPQGVPNQDYAEFKRRFSQLPAAPVVEGYGQAEELGNQMVRLVGVDLFAEAPFRNYFQGIKGSGNGFIPFLVRPGTGVISATVADHHGLALGDTLHLNIAGKSASLELVGIVTTDSTLNRRALSNLVLMDIATVQEVLGQPQTVSHIDLIVERSDTLSAIRDWLPQGLKLETAEARKNSVQQMTAAFELNLTALSLLALVVGMFLIYNTVTFSVVQRRGLFGILRCLGVTRGQLFTLILSEAALFSLVGSALGVALGVVLGRSIVGLITQTINDFYFVVSVQQITLAQSTLIKGMVVGIGAALLASALPAIEAMGTAPQLALQRSVLESRIQKLLPYLGVAWGAVTGAGVLLLLWRQGGLIAAFTGLFAVLLGAVLLTPPLVSLLMEWGNSFPWPGVVGRMAPRDIVRSLSRTSIAIAALMVSVSVIVGVSIMIGSFRGTVISWLDQTLQADIFVTPPSTTANRVMGNVDPAIVNAIKDWPHLEQVVTYNDAPVRLVDSDKDIKLIAAEGDVSQGKRPYAWIRPDLNDPWAALNENQGVIISEALYLRESGRDRIPAAITLETPAGNQSFEVLAVFYDYSSDQGTVIINQPLYESIWHDASVSSLGLFVDPESDVEATAAAIRTAFADLQGLSVQSNQGLRQGSLEIFDRTFAITGALRLLAVVVAFIGVLSTLMSLQLERGREFGILRATGMTPRQLGSLTLLETGLMGAMAGIFAMPLGFALAWILIYIINVRSFGWTLQMSLQPQYFWQSLLVAVGAALLAGIYPAVRLGRTNISTAVRQE